MSKFSQFWVYQDGSSQRLLMATSLPISFNDNTKVVHVIEYSALEQAEAKISKLEDMVYHSTRYIEQLQFEKKDLEAKLEKAKEALKQINKAELNSMRPGAGFTESAIISYQTIEELGE